MMPLVTGVYHLRRSSLIHQSAKTVSTLKNQDFRPMIPAFAGVLLAI